MSNEPRRGSLLKLRSNYPTLKNKYSKAINEINTKATNIHIRQLLNIYKKIYFYQRIFNKLTLSGKKLHIIIIKKNVMEAIQIFKLLFNKGVNNDEYDMIIVLYENILKALVGIQKQVKTYNKNNIDNYDLNMNETIKNASKMHTEMNISNLNEQIKSMKLEANTRKRSKKIKSMNKINENQ